MASSSSGDSKVIDVHAHVTPRRFQQAVVGGSLWHGMSPADGELDNLKNRWRPDRRLEEMDALGVDVQLVSPTDCFYQYHQDPEVTAAIAAECNDEVAEMARDYPSRFVGLGTLPLQDTERAVAEMERGMRQLGLAGFMIDDHVNGLLYDHDVFDPFWEAAEALGAFIFVHQGRPTSVTYRTEKYFLLNSVGNLVDRTLTFGSLVYGGVMDKYPELTVCLGHAGGYVPYAIDRMDKGWEMWPDSRGKSQDRPSTYVGRFLYDTVTYTDRNLRFLIDVVGIDRVVFGTDWPAPMVVVDPVRRIETSPVLAPDEREAILRGNMAGRLPGF
jgi:aminocarboxymuconate-semialdehyde decarboxylase